MTNENNHRSGVRVHGHAKTATRPATPTYKAWDSMIQRCHNSKHHAFENYGGRGIVVDERWRGSGGFERFLVDVGERPSPDLEIDRVDNDRGYEPGNVEWRTRAAQARNRRTTKLEPHEPAQIRWLATAYPKSVVASFFGVSPTTVRDIIENRTWQ